jgi:hypothetical protein
MGHQVFISEVEDIQTLAEESRVIAIQEIIILGSMTLPTRQTAKMPRE